MSDWNIGDRVRISMAMGLAKYPHAGKEGTITAIEPVDFGDLNINVPVITLDDGAVVKGYECWWEPTARRKGNDVTQEEVN